MPAPRTVRGAAVGLLCALVAGCGGNDPGSVLPIGPNRTTPARAPLRGHPTLSEGAFHSQSVRGVLHYEIALPPGYASSRRRYPVIYFLHGLPATGQAYRNIGGYANSLASTGHPAIIVGAQGARVGDTDPEWHDWGPGRNWETATRSDLVGWIDGHYRTLARRSARAIIGASAGGYGAALIALHHPETYQVIESWSGYFILTTPSGEPATFERIEDQGYASAHAHVPRLAQRFAPYKHTFFGFYIGNRDPYAGFVQDNVKLSRELRAAGIPHVFQIYDGSHNSTFWAQHQDEWLGGAIERLDPAS